MKQKEDFMYLCHLMRTTQTILFPIYSELDQENLLNLVSKWTEENPDDRYTCIPSGDTPSTEGLCDVEQDDDDEVVVTQPTSIWTLFFCLQSRFQRHLLQSIVLVVMACPRNFQTLSVIIVPSQLQHASCQRKDHSFQNMTYTHQNGQGC